MTNESSPQGYEIRELRGMRLVRGNEIMKVEGMRDEMGEGTVMDLYTRSDGDVGLQLTSPSGIPMEMTFAGPTGGSRHLHLARILRHIPYQLFADEGSSPFLNEETVTTYQEDLLLDVGDMESLESSVRGIKGDGGDDTVMDILIKKDGDVIVTFRNPNSKNEAEKKGYSINFNTLQGDTRIPVAGWAFKRIALCLVGKFPPQPVFST